MNVFKTLKVNGYFLETDIDKYCDGYKKMYDVCVVHFFCIIGIWFRLVDKCLKQILTMSKIKSNAPALLYFSAC